MFSNYRLTTVSCDEERQNDGELPIDKSRFNEKAFDSMYTFELLSADTCYQVVMIASNTQTRSLQQILKVHTSKYFRILFFIKHGEKKTK